MGKIVMTRVDARLAHGQVVGSWVKFLDPQRAVIIDEEAKNDVLQMRVMKLGMPGVKVKFLTPDEAIAAYAEDKFGNGKVLVIIRNIDYAYKCYQGGIQFKSVNIGQVPMVEGRKNVVSVINLSDDEMKKLEYFDSQGVEVYHQQLITEKKYNFEDFKKGFYK